MGFQRLWYFLSLVLDQVWVCEEERNGCFLNLEHLFESILHHPHFLSSFLFFLCSFLPSSFFPYLRPPLPNSLPLLVYGASSRNHCSKHQLWWGNNSIMVPRETSGNDVKDSVHRKASHMWDGCARLESRVTGEHLDGSPHPSWVLKPDKEMGRWQSGSGALALERAANAKVWRRTSCGAPGIARRQSVCEKAR